MAQCCIWWYYSDKWKVGASIDQHTSTSWIEKLPFLRKFLANFHGKSWRHAQHDHIWVKGLTHLQKRHGAAAISREIIYQWEKNLLPYSNLLSLIPKIAFYNKKPGQVTLNETRSFPAMVRWTLVVPIRNNNYYPNCCLPTHAACPR